MPRKKPSTSRNLITTLAPSTPFKSLLLAAFIVAATGIGFMIYRSFAATIVVKKASPYDAIKIYRSYGHAILQHGDAPAGIPNTDVWRIDAGGAGVAANFSFNFRAAPEVRYCILYRFSVPSNDNVVILKGYDHFIWGKLPGSRSYRRQCSAFNVVPQQIGLSKPLNVDVSNYGPGVLFIQYITVEYYYP